jgi:hypothetical protein
MITPSFALTATERVLPRLALDFTTATLDSRVTLTRTGNTATVTNSSGVIAAINANLPRFDFNPTTLVCNGLLIEDSRTNLLLNSLLDGTNLATQLVTTTAVAHTLSFYGTGQIVLSGTSSATVVGTGAYPSRKTLTFTPTVGVLTLTVTGTVQYAQLETGAFATSFIPTAASQVTRTADVAVMTGTNFSDWYNASEGAFLASAVLTRQAAIALTGIFSANDNTGLTNYMNAFYRGTGALGTNIYAGSVSQLDQNTLGVTVANTVVNIGIAYKLNNSVSYANATVQTTDTSVTIPTVTQLQLGFTPTGAYLNGILRNFRFWPQRILNAEGQAFSKG